METSDGQLTGDAARVYEEFFVPALFGEWAPRMADALEPIGVGDVVDVACGTGVLGRELARRLGPQRVHGIDRNEGMLAVARSVAPEVDWRAGTAEQLPFASDSCAAVGCQFGLMFFDDPVSALTQMWRILASGGVLAVAVWGPLAQTPGYRSMVALLDSLFGSEIARELEAPFRLGDPSKLADLFGRAGIQAPNIETIVGTARFPSIDAWIRTDVRGWTLADRIDDEQYAVLSRAGGAALCEFAGPDGSVAFASPAHVVTVRKP